VLVALQAKKRKRSEGATQVPERRHLRDNGPCPFNLGSNREEGETLQKKEERDYAKAGEKEKDSRQRCFLLRQLETTRTRQVRSIYKNQKRRKSQQVQASNFTHHTPPKSLSGFLCAEGRGAQGRYRKRRVRADTLIDFMQVEA